MVNILRTTGHPSPPNPKIKCYDRLSPSLDSEFGAQYPGVIDVWRRAWPEFIPFLDYPAELRRIVYTTNAIESINYQLRKITKTRADRQTAALLLEPRGVVNTGDAGGDLTASPQHLS